MRLTRNLAIAVIALAPAAGLPQDWPAKPIRVVIPFAAGSVSEVQYQQNLTGRKIAVLLLSTNHWPTLKKRVPLVQAALDKIRPNEFVRLEIPS